ncbi:uncharacterized protein LOC116253046 [Nymphaea colorata]|uniref:Core Histone H2A/H2B/H3 domain-containing protein n=1 Tax=Nymphaea colorata TaxID=210225 RepID=A0A5K1CYV4_9MAGN|nr:uncharacterized protein LOC116253046 [Nymphaea colorata]
MGPRRSGRLVGSVVKETKVVEETVKVVADVDDLSSLEPSAISAGIIREIPVVEIKESKTPQKKVEPEAAPFPLEKKQKGIEAKEVEEKEQKGHVDQKKERKPQELNRRRKRLRRNEEGGVGAYRSYVYKVLKQVHPELGISSKAMDVLNGFMGDMFERLAEEAATLQKHTGRRTLSSREIQMAVRLVLPGELGKHAISEGSKAITNYYRYPEKKRR